MHAVPMYIAETAPFQIRGRLISLKEFFIVLGMVVSSSTVHLWRKFVLGFPNAVKPIRSALDFLCFPTTIFS